MEAGLLNKRGTDKRKLNSASGQMEKSKKKRRISFSKRRRI